MNTYQSCNNNIVIQETIRAEYSRMPKKNGGKKASGMAEKRHHKWPDKKAS